MAARITRLPALWEATKVQRALRQYAAAVILTSARGVRSKPGEDAS